jgi:acyl dehydratase
MSFANAFYFDEVEVGQEWLSPERTVSEEDINIFAELTGDRAPMHTDEEFAKTTPYQRRIAHGLLGLSMTGGLTFEAPPVRVQAFVGLREWYFRAPIFIGDTIRVRTRVLEKELRGRGRRGQVTWGITVVNQNDRVVQEGITMTILERAVSARESILPLPKTGESQLLSEAG